MLEIEQQLQSDGYDIPIGIDEAGRGPLAGPVVASAVFIHTNEFENKIADSKKLTAKGRDRAFDEIFEKATVGIGIVDHIMIDKVNILNATLMAMNKAVNDLLSKMPDDNKTDDLKNRVFLLVDGNRFVDPCPYKYKTIIGGDAQVFSICCASIIAKVTRDRIMVEYDEKYPQYGFKGHKGYGTKAHKDALNELGRCPIHRKSFKY